MDKAAKIRWGILSSALVLTIAAIFYPVDPEVAGIAGERNAAGRLPPGSTAAGDGSAPGDTVFGDPFAPRNWRAPPPPAPQIVAAAASEPVFVGPPAPPPPVHAPALPFRFMGRLNDGGEQVLYLGRGDQILLARTGDTLDGAYKVLALDAQRVEFEHIPTGEKQSLPLPVSEN